ncbi:MAG TPA: response regulator [Polyangia bacterium]|nr:response regulator [Polyangia bacterium]
MSILVIEDDEGVRESLVAILRDEGYAAETAANGAAALRRLAQRPLPTLILLDLMMPKMDGVDFRSHQLADPELRKIPVVIISARPDVARQAAELHVDDFLRKPMSFEELLHVVQNRALTEVGVPE